MENETELEIDLDDTTEHEATPDKPVETPEAKLARLERQASQLRKKLGVQPVKTVEEDKPEEKKGGLDRIDKAILRAEKIHDADEIDLVQSIMKETGKDIEDVLESRYFKAELKALRDDKNTEEALTPSSKRSGNSNKNTVEYWIAKGEMPPASEPKLRQAYVNAKMSKMKERSMFSDNPIS